ncbi:MAG: UDP-N-acetylmuramoyl-L-alanine--D-glutamate ligase [Desulfomonile tiedjei]|uniref:UDP-N-acetylmuramoylalanine--D-glutamate ligase n=1 Tax=Desulfomonile tiedjei TaxID=2358 RepID=A0A9D6Z5N5_9BACT|nr:UDP-N-acetylmuramoyl-L-alanine--D-glutamate ligase [Desulfomonile tiedjei]
MPDPRSIFGGKKITIMGLGLLGRGLNDTLFLIRCGARVTVTDLKDAEQLAPSVERLKGLPVTLRLGEHLEQDFIDADMILRNADVPRSSKYLKIAVDHGIPVEMDESLFCKFFQGKIVGITGTRGKTTTTMLAHKILSARGRKVFLAGNILGQATLPLLGEAQREDIVVLELSSWQLQGFHEARLSPAASVFTNIFPDHLNRYSGMEEYINDKKAVYAYQSHGDFCVFNGEQPETAALAKEAPAGARFFRVADVPGDWSIRLPGAHNRQNVAAALSLTRNLGVPTGLIRKTVEEFRSVEHRLQWLGEKDGIGFINDSTSTTPVAGCAALNSVDAKRILLIAGGSDKKLDLRPFASEAAAKAHKIALLNGNATETLLDGIAAAGGEGKVLGPFDNLASAVESLHGEARSGDVILLSPGCASFGMFKNEYHRGETFIGIVREILED